MEHTDTKAKTSIILTRLPGPPDRVTLGKMAYGGLTPLDTLEPSLVNPFHSGHPRMPAGTYLVKVTQSPDLGYRCPEVLGVPGRTGIRIHIGNFGKDTLGCVLVGLDATSDHLAVEHSTVAFKSLMDWIDGLHTGLQLVVIDA